MRSGRLRHVVTIQSVALSTADAYGAVSQVWSDVATVRAEVKTLIGLESWRAKQQQPEATDQVLLRYTGDMNSTRRLRFGSRYLYPLSSVPDVRNRQLTVLCREKL
jgi:SPP1 family predicted phage head-tail adaptor